MRVLILHQNFPGQFVHLAPALVAQGHEVHALALRKGLPPKWSGVTLHAYSPPKGNAKDIHPWLLDLESKVIRGDAVFRKCLALAAEGFSPDVVIAHPGWGESLFVKDVWPNTRLGLYCEFNYSESGNDVGFDPEFEVIDRGNACRLRLKNINNLLHFDLADSAVSPTQFQADTFPQPFRSKISVLHDGINTREITPNPDATVKFDGGLTLSTADEVITFANRNLEPYRGYHVFMRALPRLLKERPDAEVVIVGGDGVSYGRQAPGGKTWKAVFEEEVQAQVEPKDWGRVHFVGHLPHDQFIRLIQVSTVHVYLTYPFVLSWGMLEAMSAGCAIVGSDTDPVKEFITDGETGLLVPFFDRDGLVDRVTYLLENATLRVELGRRAREKIQSFYDLKSVCLPRMIDWVETLALR
jgi:glycosyltransferase involved in cell wall biosynthesis